MNCKNLTAVVVLVMTGCVAVQDGEPTSDRIGTVQNSQIVANQLVANQLVANQLVANQLVANQLGSVTLLTENSHDIETTAGGRQVLKYMVQCALGSEDILRFEHDSVPYEYPGALALAPDWKTRALNTEEKATISACLIASINAVGESVQISTRMYGHVSANAAERALYPVLEGSFFGSVFDDGELTMYACQGSHEDIASVHSGDRLDRVCAEASTTCDVTYVGRCRDVCERFDENYGWRKCWAEGVRHDEVMTVYLKADDPDGENADCSGSGSCQEQVACNNAGIVDCDNAGSCDLWCGGNGHCTFSARSAGNVKIKAEPGSKMEVDCAGSGTCEVDCQGAMCEVACEGAGSCNEVKCRDGASCLLYCEGAGSCSFESCTGGQTSCGDGLVACGQSCP